MDGYDISRIPQGSEPQHYAALLLQAGRLMGDWDVNFSQEIIQEDQQRTRRHVIGPYGSPDRGFRIDNLRAEGDQFDFDIHHGSIYLGGLRLTMERAAGNPNPALGESFLTQRDWLQQGAEESAAIPALEEGEERFDLVYLEAWQQAVSAIEDSELFEVALGGPDTSTRLRNMRRVKLASGLNERDCLAAWNAFCQQLRDANQGYVSPQHEWHTDARLAVSYVEIDDPDDLCAPGAVGGYLGAENQSIRVQLRGSNELIWGYDNASPLYRVEADGNEVTLLTDPKDQHHWPLAGQIVEILPWSAVLANEEKIATRQGHLSRVATSYNPDTGVLTLSDPLPAGFGTDWQSRSDAGELLDADATPYFFLRVWRGIPDDEPMVYPFNAGDTLTLGNTGIAVTITGDHLRAGDFWVIGARPETPNQVVPWALEEDEGMPVHGCRKFLAPLAIIRWANVNGVVIGEVIRDCRKTFRPLTDLEGCCTYHVGDGVTSHGDYNSIEEAIQNLPERGGQICVLAGRHQANVSIFNRSNICISGCGDRSIVESREPGKPIFALENVQNLCIEKLSLVAPEGTAIYLLDRQEEELTPSIQVKIRHNRVLAGVYGIYVEVDDEEGGENHIDISHNQVAIHDHEGGRVGIFCLADEVRIERNKVVVIPPPEPDDPNDPQDEPDPPGGIFDPCGDLSGILQTDFELASYLQLFFQRFSLIQSFASTRVFTAWGGIQIGGGSENVLVHENTIIGGRTNGITLGHFPSEGRLQNDPEDLRREVLAAREEAATNGTFLRGGRSDQLRARMLTAFRSFLYNITISENQIRDMGLSGIAALAFFDEESANDGLIVQAENLTIYRNTIQRCARQLPEELETLSEAGFGGIALSGCENGRIEENLIEDCGQSFVDPICGIFISYGEYIEISRNRILNNGPRLSLTGENFGLSAQARPGNRGGIYIGMAFMRQLQTGIVGEILSKGVPAVKIHDNIVVQPLGHALFIMAFGPVSVVGNQLTSHELDLGHPLSIVAGAVMIMNLGISKDVMRFFLEPSLRDLANIEPDPTTGENSNNDLAAVNLFLLLLQYLPSGSVMFANNQTTLDMRNLEFDLAMSAQAIISLDDISYTGNQSECKGLAALVPGREDPLFALDYLIFNTALIGMTIRTADNRFQEGFTAVLYSLFSLGFANTTTGNQSSNCMLTNGTREVFANNIEQILGLQECDQRKLTLGKSMGIGKGLGTSNMTYDGSKTLRKI